MLNWNTRTFVVCSWPSSGALFGQNLDVVAQLLSAVTSIVDVQTELISYEAINIKCYECAFLLWETAVAQ